MKKMILGLLLTAISGVAHAGLTPVTDKAEIDAIKTATKMALTEKTKMSCTNSQGTIEYQTSDFDDLIKYSGTVYRSDNGQPVLQFIYEYYNSTRHALSITTDSSGTKIVSLNYVQQTLSADKTINLGTIANPKLQVVPGQWENTAEMTCTPK